MKLLDKHSMPVWMLADGLLVLSALGSMAFLSGLVPAPTQDQWTRHSADLNQQLKLARDQVKRSQQDLSAKSQDTNRREQELTGTIEQLTDKNKRLNKYQDEASSWITWAQQEFKRLEALDQSELKLRQELLNLRGDFSRVVFVIDRSGSMGNKPASDLPRPNWGADGLPWTYVQNQVRSWLQNLSVSSFRMVCFNHEVIEFPVNDPKWSEGTEATQEAVKFLQQIKPTGGTNTEQALRRAMSYNPTAIILFTDGAPTNQKGELDIEQQGRIIAWLKKEHPQVPVNVIAVSNYFNEKFSSFLHGIASSTGGGFVGL